MRGTKKVAFLKKYAFHFAVLALCLVMAGYLLYMYVLKPEAPFPVVKAAPAFSLTSIDGEEVSLESTSGKKRIVYFYFASCPDVCPPTTYLLGELQDILREKGELGSEVELISITFDPETDTDEVIREFAESTGAELDGWHFVRGTNKEEAIELARAFDLAVIYDEVEKTFIHQNPIILLDENNNLRAWINGTPNLEAGDEPLTAEALYEALKKVR